MNFIFGIFHGFFSSFLFSDYNFDFSHSAENSVLDRIFGIGWEICSMGNQM